MVAIFQSHVVGGGGTNSTGGSGNSPPQRLKAIIEPLAEALLTLSQDHQADLPDLRLTIQSLPLTKGLLDDALEALGAVDRLQYQQQFEYARNRLDRAGKRVVNYLRHLNDPATRRPSIQG